MNISIFVNSRLYGISVLNHEFRHVARSENLGAKLYMGAKNLGSEKKIIIIIFSWIYISSSYLKYIKLSGLVHTLKTIFDKCNFSPNYPDSSLLVDFAGLVQCNARRLSSTYFNEGESSKFTKAIF